MPIDSPNINFLTSSITPMLMLCYNNIELGLFKIINDLNCDFAKIYCFIAIIKIFHYND